MSMRYEIGLVGLGVMGRNFLLNFADQGRSVIGYDTDAEKVERLKQEGDPTRVGGATSLATFVASLQTPRTIILLVPAGAPVDAALSALRPHLTSGDRVIDGGNSHFRDTERREKDFSASGICYAGMGISGGEEGARRGPSMMFGGEKATYAALRPWLESVAAKADGEPCVAYVGPRGAGHYVKMVHNAIEYGWMQLLAESADLLHRGAGLEWDAVAQRFATWNRGELGAFLVEITSEILAKSDPLTGGKLVDSISDVARSKGTGKWATEEAHSLQVPVPTIGAAVTWRELSRWQDERGSLAKTWGSSTERVGEDATTFTNRVGEALHAALWITLAQGMMLLRESSLAYEYDLNPEAVTRVWRAGCILRSRVLETATSAYRRQPDLSHLLEAREIGERITSESESLRRVCAKSIEAGLAAPGLTSSLQYWDAFRDLRLPMAIVQGQRDYFGAHGYERTDRAGTFHTDWKSER